MTDLDIALKSTSDIIAARIVKALARMNDDRWCVLDDVIDITFDQKVFDHLRDSSITGGTFDVLAAYDLKTIPTYADVKHIFEPPTHIPFTGLRRDSDEHFAILNAVFTSREARMRHNGAMFATMLAGSQAPTQHLYKLWTSHTVYGLSEESSVIEPSVSSQSTLLGRLRTLIQSFNLTLDLNDNLMRPISPRSERRETYSRERVVETLLVVLDEHGHSVSRDLLEAALSIYPYASK